VEGAVPLSTSVDVHYSPPILLFSKSVDATVNVGGTFNFSCNSCNATNILYQQWQYSAPPYQPVVLSNESDGRISITPNFNLQMRDIHFEESGTYECVVGNHLGKLTLRSNLSVIGESHSHIPT